MDTFETAAQRQKLSPDAKVAMEAEALQQFQQRVEAARAAKNASDTVSLLQGQKLSPVQAASLEQTRAAQEASRAAKIVMEAEALQQLQKRVEETRAAKNASDTATLLQRTRAAQDAFEAEVLAQRQQLSSDAASPVRGGFAEEVKSPLFDQTFLAF